MRNSFDYGVGGVLSADIAVPEHEHELAFYSSVLTTGDAPLWQDDLMNNLGEPIIGLGVRIPEYEMLPLQWMPHFQVADVATSAQCAVDLGGKEIMHGKDEDGQSQWAALSDPFGAAFGIIPVVEEDQATENRQQRRGCIRWLSLTVPDATASQDFYQQVIGWEGKPMAPDESERYSAGFEMHKHDGIAAAEILQRRNGSDEIPAVWLMHLPVDDLAESLRRVNLGNGKVIEHLSGEPATVRDPIGIYFALQTL